MICQESRHHFLSFLLFFFLVLINIIINQLSFLAQTFSPFSSLFFSCFFFPFLFFLLFSSYFLFLLILSFFSPLLSFYVQKSVYFIWALWIHDCIIGLVLHVLYSAYPTFRMTHKSSSLHVSFGPMLAVQRSLACTDQNVNIWWYASYGFSFAAPIDQVFVTRI